MWARRRGSVIHVFFRFSCFFPSNLEGHPPCHPETPVSDTQQHQLFITRLEISSKSTSFASGVNSVGKLRCLRCPGTLTAAQPSSPRKSLDSQPCKLPRQFFIGPLVRVVPSCLKLNPGPHNYRTPPKKCMEESKV